MPLRFRMPPIIQYSGSKDPTEHVESYRSWIQIQSASDAMICPAFSITLTGAVRNWYRWLRLRSINTFTELNRSFLTQFIVGKKSRKSSTHLLTLKQKSEESLKDYISRFNEETLQVGDYSDKMALSAMISGLKEGRFLLSIGKNPDSTLSELISRAQKYTNAKEFSSSRKSNQTSESSSKGKRRRDEAPRHANKRSDDNATWDRRPSRKSDMKFHSYTPLNTSPEQILQDIQDQRLLHWPSCMKTYAGQRDKHKYYRFHCDHGHNTSDCVDLKDEIKTLICKGHLRQYTKEERQTWKYD
ncbi:uncharacterized protein LOC131254986 [Magnolia sinica]|uniref:uncharacterized protein LOC131254986 n=1 Tax=Magnolia sinica TaxID=86752 RepID=UPI0026582BF4|nr:uncharacterized protein LOC131254986 [Magnolia sinica]